MCQILHGILKGEGGRGVCIKFFKISIFALLNRHHSWQSPGRAVGSPSMVMTIMFIRRDGLLQEWPGNLKAFPLVYPVRLTAGTCRVGLSESGGVGGGFSQPPFLNSLKSLLPPPHNQLYHSDAIPCALLRRASLSTSYKRRNSRSILYQAQLAAVLQPVSFRRSKPPFLLRYSPRPSYSYNRIPPPPQCKSYEHNHLSSQRAIP
jgi:hypothetical protein